MSLRSIAGCLPLALGAMLTASPVVAERTALGEASVADAIRYLGLLAGREIATDDAAWLERQWAEEHAASPETVAAEIDDLAFALERHRRDGDGIALANARAAAVKNAYCAAEQFSDPATHRLREILAPDDLTLASDCILGLVVTRFDVDGLIASHALTASATGQPHDAEGDRAEVVATITAGFAGASAADKAVLANGELRHAVLARFWSRIDGTREQAAVVQDIGSAAASDLRLPARRLEELALSKLGEVDYLARIGDARLTSSAIGTYEEWLGRIAGYGFDSRVRDWLQQAIIREFQENPAKVLDEIAGIETLNRDYALADGAQEKAGLVDRWAADLHCYLSGSSDADEVRLAEVVFREDPVIDADCGAGRVRRQHQTVLAEAGGRTLLEQDLELSRRFAAMLLGRPLLPEEEAVIREDNIRSFEKDPAAWQEENEQYRALLATVEKHESSVFLAMDERKKLFDPIYCALKTSKEAYADDYLAMFERGGAILFEDCDQELVTTEDEVQAIVSVANFLALLNDRPPLGPGEVDEIREGFKSQNLGDAESSMLALREWWSLLSLEERAAEAENARARGITIEADAETVRSFIHKVKLDVVLKNAKLNSCRMAAIITQGQTAIYGASMGPGKFTENNPSGIPGEQLAGLISSSNLLGELCKDVLGG